jgi:hypothetical protein
MLLFDEEETKRQRRDRAAGGGRTDGSFTRIVVHLADYRPANGEWQGPVAQSFEWEDIFGDARRYPDVPGIQALHQVDQKLPTWVFRLASRVEAEERGQ